MYGLSRCMGFKVHNVLCPDTWYPDNDHQILCPLRHMKMASNIKAELTFKYQECSLLNIIL